ncbi:hypothetical protein DPX16_21821 [Anabarilius grahami]|uniref:Uncharacterized protein n=1 Tax=Anabarilius grahami TaxID=495550 RepID=A0A3N0YQ55_ANAGA|nr:hypothetical protein DPX16_21821 [Anabarilius grahami]
MRNFVLYVCVRVVVVSVCVRGLFLVRTSREFGEFSEDVHGDGIPELSLLQGNGTGLQLLLGVRLCFVHSTRSPRQMRIASSRHGRCCEPRHGRAGAASPDMGTDAGRLADFRTVTKDYPIA